MVQIESNLTQTDYFDIELDGFMNSEEGRFHGNASIRRIPSRIVPLYSASDWKR